MRESEFWQRVRKLLPPRMFARRIEDASGNLGTWDTFVAMDGVAAWIELKVAGPNAKPTLRPGQAAFGASLFDAGIAAGYLIGCKDGSMRLVGPLTTGDDWRDHLVGRYAIDAKGIAAVLAELGFVEV